MGIMSSDGMEMTYAPIPGVEQKMMPEGAEEGKPFLQSCSDWALKAEECNCAAVEKYNANLPQNKNHDYGFDKCNAIKEGPYTIRSYSTCKDIGDTTKAPILTTKDIGDTTKAPATSATGAIGLNVLIGFATSTFFWML